MIRLYVYHRENNTWKYNVSFLSLNQTPRHVVVTKAPHARSSFSEETVPFLCETKCVFCRNSVFESTWFTIERC